MTCLDNATKEQLASLCKEKEIPVLWEEPMKHYTSFQIGESCVGSMYSQKSGTAVLLALVFEKNADKPLVCWKWFQSADLGRRIKRCCDSAGF